MATQELDDGDGDGTSRQPAQVVLPEEVGEPATEPKDDPEIIVDGDSEDDATKSMMIDQLDEMETDVEKRITIAGAWKFETNAATTELTDAVQTYQRELMFFHSELTHTNKLQDDNDKLGKYQQNKDRHQALLFEHYKIQERIRKANSQTVLAVSHSQTRKRKLACPQESKTKGQKAT